MHDRRFALSGTGVLESRWECEDTKAGPVLVWTILGWKAFAHAILLGVGSDSICELMPHPSFYLMCLSTAIREEISVQHLFFAQPRNETNRMPTYLKANP